MMRYGKPKIYIFKRKMMKKLILALIPSFFIVLTGCKNENKADAQDIEIQAVSETPFKEVTTLEEISRLANHGKLHEAFAKGDMKSELISANEGMSFLKSTTIYPGTGNEVEIDFLPNDSTRVWRVTVTNRSNKFHSKTGVTPGMTLEELNAINKIPVNFYGFQWEFAGAVDFNDGNLTNDKLFVYLKTDKEVPKEFIGDAPHSSLDEKAKELKLYVHKIIYEAATAEPL